MGTFSITKVTGAPPGMLVASGGHAQPSANGSNAVVTTGNAKDEQPNGALCCT